MINWHSQAADQLILEKLLIMRPSANIAIFRLGISLLTALPMACFYANKAISQTDDISQLPVSAELSADTGNGVLALQKLEIKQDETPTNLNQLPDSIESNPEPETPPNRVENRQDACSTSSLIDCGTGILPVAKNLVDNDPQYQNPLDCNFLAQNPQTPPGNLPPDLNPDLVPNPLLPPPPPVPDPNRDRFLQPVPQPSPEPPQVPPTVPPQPPSPVPPTLPNAAIEVQKIQVVGSTILSQDEINALVKPLEGSSATLEQLKQIADKITEIYLNRGYITSRAVLPPQTITAGVVKIQVIEGKLTRIEIEGTKRLDPSYIRSRIRLGARMPLSTASLEDQLRLLRVDPLFDNVEASLRAGDNEGESILIVRVSEANPFQPSFSIDNYSPPSVGSERVGVSLRHRNITGNGDELGAAYYRSIGDSDWFDFIYRLPLNAMNGTLQLRAAPNRNGIVEPAFKSLDITGKSHLFEVSYRQPLIRTPIEEFALSTGFTYQIGRTFIAGEPTSFNLRQPESNGVTTTSAIKLGQDYIRRDPQGAWAVRSQFTIGTSLFDATQFEGSEADGQFFSWLGQVQRVQRLNDKHLLILQSDLQLSANSLLPSQQFVIGGGQSLRGYRQNARSGDNGLRVSIEDRITLQRDPSGNPKLQLAPFLEAGTVWNAANNPNKLPNQRFLAGVGLGVIWEPIPRLNLRVDYAFPLVRISDRGDNLQDKGIDR